MQQCWQALSLETLTFVGVRIEPSLPDRCVRVLDLQAASKTLSNARSHDHFTEARPYELCELAII